MSLGWQRKRINRSSSPFLRERCALNSLDQVIKDLHYVRIPYPGSPKLGKFVQNDRRLIDVTSLQQLTRQGSEWAGCAFTSGLTILQSFYNLRGPRNGSLESHSGGRNTSEIGELLRETSAGQGGSQEKHWTTTFAC